MRVFNFSSTEKNKSGFSAADFNGNNLDDIVFGTDSKNLYLVYDNGDIADGFPFESDGRFRISPIIIEHLNEKLIVAPSENNTLYVLSQDGSLLFDIIFSNKITTSPSVLIIIILLLFLLVLVMVVYLELIYLVI